MIQHIYDISEDRTIWYDLKAVKISSNCKDDWCFVIDNEGQAYFVRPHRENEPAIIYHGCNTEEYYIEGQSHNENGPAIIYLDGRIFWYLNGKNYSFKNWCEKL